MINLSKIYWCEDVGLDKKKILADWHLPLDSLVHASHCTVEGGCKYGDKDCVVENGVVKQLFPYDPNWD